MSNIRQTYHQCVKGQISDIDYIFDITESKIKILAGLDGEGWHEDLEDESRPIELDEIDQRNGILHDIIKPFEDNRDAHVIIRGYLRKNHFEKMIVY